jgi:hypothetical protein
LGEGTRAEDGAAREYGKHLQEHAHCSLSFLALIAMVCMDFDGFNDRAHCVPPEDRNDLNAALSS